MGGIDVGQTKLFSQEDVPSKEVFLYQFEERLKYLGLFVKMEALDNLRQYASALYCVVADGKILDFDRLMPVVPLDQLKFGTPVNHAQIDMDKLVSESTFIGPYWLLGARFEPLRSICKDQVGNFVETVIATVIWGSERNYYKFPLPDHLDKSMNNLALVRRDFIDVELCRTDITVGRRRLVYKNRVGSPDNEKHLVYNYRIGSDRAIKRQ